MSLAYLSDIFSHLNVVNKTLQGPDINRIIAHEHVRASKQKLTVWKKRVEVENLANFSLLETEIQQAEDGLPQELRDQIIEHLESLCETVQDNVGDVEELNSLEPFRIDVSTIGDDEPFIADKLIDLQNSSDKKDLFVASFGAVNKRSFPT